ncbi:MAG TPA: HAD family hydrolase [Candidatus Saccharimonadales bacterium]|nr:HAD family hydrolase [Candidatus Saccharimonadales bacterium]
MKDFILYVDFDKTLYENRRFNPDLLGIVSDKTSVPLDEIESTVHRFSSHPGLGGYDFAAHMAHYGLDPEDMWQQLERIVQQKDYLYPDSIPFMQQVRQRGHQPKILTFGEKRFQMIKIVPVLPLLADEQGNHPEVTVVDKRKHEHIRKLHPGQRGALIDDVPNQDLPEGFTEIHIDRASNLAAPLRKDNGYTVRDLMQALAVLELLAEDRSEP